MSYSVGFLFFFFVLFLLSNIEHCILLTAPFTLSFESFSSFLY